MKALPTNFALTLLRHVVLPMVAPLTHVDGAPVELFRPNLAAELVPHVYRPRLSALLAAAMH